MQAAADDDEICIQHHAHIESAIKCKREQAVAFHDISLYEKKQPIIAAICVGQAMLQKGAPNAGLKEVQHACVK